jgi:hypothetical protein
MTCMSVRGSSLGTKTTQTGGISQDCVACLYTANRSLLILPEAVDLLFNKETELHYRYVLFTCGLFNDAVSSSDCNVKW